MLSTIVVLGFYVSSLAAAHDHNTDSSKTNNKNSQGPRIEIYNDAAGKIIDHHASINVLGTGYWWSEGPVWVEDGDFLLFSDVPRNTIYKYKEGQSVSEYLAPSGSTNLIPNSGKQGSNGLLINDQGKLVIMQHGDRRVAVLNDKLTSSDPDYRPKPNYTTLVSHYKNKRLNSPNDAIFDSNGNLYFTDPPYGLDQIMNDPAKELDFQGVYKLKTSGELALIDDSVSFPNGIILFDNEQQLLVAVSDPAKLEWVAYSKDANGTFTNKRTFFDASLLVDKKGHEGYPDGMVLHSSGNIFATGPGGVWLFSPTGDVLAKIFTGKKTANCTLSADEKTLYMTAHDQLLSVSLL